MVHTTKISKVVVCYFWLQKFWILCGSKFWLPSTNLCILFFGCVLGGEAEGRGSGVEGGWGGEGVHGGRGGQAVFIFGRKRIVGIRVWWEWEGAC